MVGHNSQTCDYSFTREARVIDAGALQCLNEVFERASGVLVDVSLFGMHRRSVGPNSI